MVAPEAARSKTYVSKRSLALQTKKKKVIQIQQKNEDVGKASIVTSEQETKNCAKS